MGQLRIADSIRLILAMFRIYADIEANFGKAVVDILKQQYPDADVDADPAQVGHKMMNIARKELQQNEQDAYDSIQEFLTYITTGSTLEAGEEGEGQVPRTTAKPFDFTEGSKTWKDALLNIYNNLRRRGISRSKGKMKRLKEEKGIDEAYGRRTDEGGAEGGEGRMPTPKDNALGEALDDVAAIREFYNLIDEHIPDLKASMSEDTRALFELIFDHETGGFGGDIKENMGQASEFKKNFPDVFERFIDGPGASVKDDEKKLRLKWSAYVGKLRNRLLDEIWGYIDTKMSDKDYMKLREEFFSDTDPSYTARKKREKEEGKASYQQMRDENSIARMKAELEEKAELSDSDQKKFDKLVEKLKGQGVDVDAIEANAAAGAKGKKEQRTPTSASASTVAAAFHLASLRHRPVWAVPGA